tara:strand:+ start:4768 stop:5190 length:423 start_codon:yes stop_codon:yes gene_type:complete
MDENKLNYYKTIFGNMCSIREYNNFANICVYVKNINVKFIKNIFDDFIEYMKYIVNKGLEVSKNFNNDQFCVHVYLEGATLKNFSIPLFKKINKIFMEGTEDILNTLYIYNNNPVCIKIIQLVKQIMDKDTRKKIVIIKH